MKSLQLLVSSSTVLFVAMAALAGMPATGPKIHGKVCDAATGKPIRGVHIMAFHDGTGQTVEVATDSTGSYRLWVGDASIVVFNTIGYHTRALKWPQDLSGSKDESKPPFRVKDVLLQRKK